MKRIIVALALVAALGACSDKKTAQRALEQQGYTNITLFGWTMFGCGNDDEFTTEFKATSPAGIAVEGVVCSGWFKGATIRTY